MYTPREARFATRSEIVSILKNARKEREEEVGRVLSFKNLSIF